MAEENPERRDWADHTAEFSELVRSAYLGEDLARTEAHWIRLLMKVRDDELVLLAQARPVAKMSVYQEAIAAEIARRNVEAVIRNEEALRESRTAIDKTTAALVEFKEASATASAHLEALTRWLIAFTAAVVLLTIVLVVHDLR
jgi:hypothetical protein